MPSAAHIEFLDRVVRLETLPWPRVEILLEKVGCLLIPVGATEQHGPHLPINTDTVIAERLCAFASGRTGVPVLPAISYSVSTGHTLKWPGTFSLRHETLIAEMCEMVSWAVGSGWRQVVLVNSHFGNDAPLRVAVDRLRLRHLGKLQIALVNSFELSPEIWNYFTSDAEDLHANKAETDLMLYLSPQTVHMEAVEDDPDRTVDKVFSYPVSQTSLNGVTGSPSLGTAAQGEWLFGLMGQALAELVDRARSESPPLPASEWAGSSDPF
ncbi:MAG: creatininase family protein [Verrucomicrobiota bacterium]